MVSWRKAAPVPVCLPAQSIQTILASWGANGTWEEASSSDAPLFYSSPHFVEELGDRCLSFVLQPQYRTGCGPDEERQKVLRLRWRAAGVGRDVGGGAALPPIPPWDRVAACEALADRVVIVVGDSLSGLFFHTLNSALRWPGANASSAQLPPAGAPSALETICAACNGPSEAGVKLLLLRLNHLPSSGEQFSAVVEGALAEGYAEEQLIWVVNWGHWLYDTNGLESGAQQGVADVLALLRKEAPQSTIFWRTAPAGHPDAIYHSDIRTAAPLSVPLSPDHFLTGMDLPPQVLAIGIPGYLKGWLELDHAQEALVEMLQSSDKELFVLDVTTSTRLRHDSHPAGDGLHYCMPGPVDSWVRLFIAAVQLLECR